jgi:AraC-like DNA-binding protein
VTRQGVEDRASINSRRMQRVADRYLRDCYRRRTAVRVSELAQELGVTLPHLSTTFREATGVSLSDYLKPRQARYAEFLLRTTTLGLSDIAAAAGFGTPNTFARIFSRLYGAPPDTYRSHLKN